MLRISKLADYGTVMMTQMAGEPSKIHKAKEIAAETGIPWTTVSKLLKMLGKGDLVISRQGVQGGYLLARAPKDITIAEIIHSIEGNVAMTQCSKTHNNCSIQHTCRIRGNWQLINNAITEALNALTLADMVQPLTATMLHFPKTQFEPIPEVFNDSNQ